MTGRSNICYTTTNLPKKFLSAILKENIIHLETRSVELPYLKDGKRFVSLFDFKALIETKQKKY